jgi:hypothetical protein
MIRTALLAVAWLLFLQNGALAQEPRSQDKRLILFDKSPKTILVNGYSTSFHWPDLLQQKLDQHTDGKRVLTVKSATKGGTPIARWIDVRTGSPLKPWLTILRPALEAADKPVVVLAQQSLQWTFGDRSVGITSKNDDARIKQGAAALKKYASLLKQDGASLVFIATHIYKHPMEPAIGNERLALARFLAQKPDRVQSGPDVWNPTRKEYPRAFARDGVHPNDLGAEIMAQLWFDTLLAYDDHQDDQTHH